jgi:hypothetical protein
MKDLSVITMLYESINNLENYKKSLSDYLKQYNMVVDGIPRSNQIAILLNGEMIGKVERKFSGNILTIELIKAYESGHGLTEKTLIHDKMFDGNNKYSVKIDILNRIVADKFMKIFSDWNIQKVGKTVYIANRP